MNEIMQQDQQWIAGTYRRFPVQLVRGEGALLWDDQGKQYIDLGSGIAVNTLGSGHAGWCQAVTRQAAQLAHTSNLYYTQPCVDLARTLCQRTGMQKVFFCNSGAEANECAIKAARKYATQTLGPEHSWIITLEGSSHGRTITTLAATGQEVFHSQFQPLTEGFLHAKVGDLQQMEQLLEQYPCAAVMMELVQGEGGVQVLAPDHVQQVCRMAHQHGALVIIDEVQTGNGRCGTLYAYQQYGIQPDLVSTVKGLARGLPLGAVLFAQKTAQVFGPGDHGSTFGGNPVCCAGALAVLAELGEQLLAQVRAKGQWVKEQLSQAPGICGVQGLGLMLGVETQRPAAQVIEECRQRGVLVLSAKNKVRLLPPLNIPQPLLEQAVKVLKEVCADTP